MRKRREQTNSATRYFDYSLLFIIFFLVCFGLVMLYSTSSYDGQIKFEDGAYYVKKQFFAASLGFFAMYIVSKIDYHFWIRFAGIAYIAALVLCTSVIFIGSEFNGQKRWLKLGPLSFQPSEFAKIAVILFLAVLISKMPKQMKKFSTVIKILAISLPIIGVIAYNNLSTAIIILGITVLMSFVASPRYAQFFALGGLGIVFGSIFIYLERYRADRIKIWLNPENYEKGYQTLQGLYAIGSGKLFGKGLGESMQKLGFLPEAQNDMIFSIICE
ncbi:MAG: FtsW/RodA/SpoVE family cell cycle protein, partial [Lachnospiraceae bacterium]|nr:FtsW/RodA/SpoVE family cell cycle protein [Lachnospiraceae bacterium]